METNNSTFKAFRVEEISGKFASSIQTMPMESLAGEGLLIRVHYSSLNYKDALSASGNKGVTRKYPHTPGIDAVGTVVESPSAEFAVGDSVIVTSYDLGMNTNGGFGEYIRVPADWALKLPKNMSMQEAMIYGTAGLTAGMSVWQLSKLLKPEDGKVIVSGATGGVGSLSVSILSKLGYEVLAITGKASEEDYLKRLGAREIILRQDFENLDAKPLLKPSYAGGIDTVGGLILQNIIKSTQPMGAITCCGNVASPKLDLTVFPFILRGISLIGIDSQNFPMKLRKIVWEKLANEWKPDTLMDTFDQINLDQLQGKIDLMLKGELRKRTLVEMISEG
ncbi:alcohol dehydrogenase [Echinicola pacifica]|uniref:Alcohol dehydrogenase n=1 Tax=Echinicola pacifica TaxID=346377 RepID=A0A918PYL9_9BACT|nr:YhdH/YhfP family quinone oxidoreductase [Echinicola pacifica]GGZ25335.1 alcohol dehydrogenase [Echinicola pacifica]